MQLLDHSTCPNDEMGVIALIENSVLLPKPQHHGIVSEETTRANSNINNNSIKNKDGNREYLQSQLHLPLRSLSLSELRILATRLQLNHSNCIHRLDIITLIEYCTLTLPLQMENDNATISRAMATSDGNNNTTTSKGDNMSAEKKSVPSLPLSTNGRSNAAPLAINNNHSKDKINEKGNAEIPSKEKDNKEKDNNSHHLVANSYREYLQSIRDGGYKFYNNDTTNNATAMGSFVRLPSNDTDAQEEVAISHHHPPPSQSTDQYYLAAPPAHPPPPPPPRRRLNSQVDKVSDNDGSPIVADEVCPVITTVPPPPTLPR